MRILASITAAVLLTLCVASCDEPSAAPGPDADRTELRGLETPCEDSCFPLLQNCDAGESCQWTGEGWACADAGNSSVGDACGGPDECSAGLLCVEGEFVEGCGASKCCADLCYAEDSNDTCPGASRCIDVFIGDGEEAGLCLVPRLPEIASPLCEEMQEAPQEPSKF
jgi:hypothetical protein